MVVKAAVVQAEPEWLDLQASVEKTCRFIGDAANGKAQIVAFPELWVPGYPGWIWYGYQTKDRPCRSLLTSPGADQWTPSSMSSSSRTR